ncbi:hypothetical protein K503DRAFT_806147 [Rhizopogon vinicolor AM-OR11-026]|uniref:Uncharacterized protein n=1 Tax=Rhizopogon vinicolor AM-OR11-026 TaxID=1314800 RepID=A0A1B7MFG2_9AGAM|nr:hypothetical protein K503DRAFT_806147 [Rhizopogon vinicolor AM-OR11-026]
MAMTITEQLLYLLQAATYTHSPSYSKVHIPHHSQCPTMAPTSLPSSYYPGAPKTKFNLLLPL